MSTRVPARSDERGFTLIEVLIATGVWVVLGGILLYVTQGVFASASTMAAARSAYLSLTRLVEGWGAEASSSLAIFVPPLDVLGADNADGHEFDFYARDALRRGHFWAYRFDAATHAVRRYTYAAPGSLAMPSEPSLTGIGSMHAQRVPASALRPPFLNGYAPRDVAVNFGYPGVDGGNAITSVAVSNAHGSFTVELLPGTMVSGFAVVVATFAPSAPATATPNGSGGAGSNPNPAPTPAPSTAAPTQPATTSQPSATATATPAQPPSATGTPLAPATATPPPSGQQLVQLNVCVTRIHQDGGGCVDTPEWLCQRFMSGSGAWVTVDTWIDADHAWADPPPDWCST